MKQGKESMNKAMRKYALMTDSEKEVFKRDCQRGMGSICEAMTCVECIAKKAYIGQEEKETAPCTQD